LHNVAEKRPTATGFRHEPVEKVEQSIACSEPAELALGHFAYLPFSLHTVRQSSFFSSFFLFVRVINPRPALPLVCVLVSLTFSPSVAARAEECEM